jgi:hypothetical protein
MQYFASLKVKETYNLSRFPKPKVTAESTAVRLPKARILQAQMDETVFSLCRSMTLPVKTSFLFRQRTENKLVIARFIATKNYFQQADTGLPRFQPAAEREKAPIVHSTLVTLYGAKRK